MVRQLMVRQMMVRQLKAALGKQSQQKQQYWIFVTTFCSVFVTFNWHLAFRVCTLIDINTYCIIVCAVATVKHIDFFYTNGKSNIMTRTAYRLHSASMCGIGTQVCSLSIFSDNFLHQGPFNKWGFIIGREKRGRTKAFISHWPFCSCIKHQLSALTAFLSWRLAVS